MNGRRHALTGAVAGVATAPFAALVGLPHAAWVAAAIAGSIVPDVDHPDATIAHMWGPITRVPAGLVSRMLGGHRGVTHGRTGVLFAVLVVALAAANPYTSALAWAWLTGVFIAAAARVSGCRNRPVLNLALSAAVGWWAWTGGWPLLLLAAPVAVGVATHILGDLIPDSSPAARVVEAASYVALAAWASWPLWLPYITERITA